MEYRTKTCIICGRPAEQHHVFFGNPNRRHSETYGLVVGLCPEHHRGPTGPHQNRENDMRLKITAQADFEKEHTREEFIRIFGRSYL